MASDAALSVSGSPACRGSDRLSVAHEPRERVAHRYIVPGVPDSERDLGSRARLVSKHTLDASSQWSGFHLCHRCLINARNTTILSAR